MGDLHPDGPSVPFTRFRGGTLWIDVIFLAFRRSPPGHLPCCPAAQSVSKNLSRINLLEPGRSCLRITRKTLARIRRVCSFLMVTVAIHLFSCAPTFQNLPRAPQTKAQLKKTRPSCKEWSPILARTL